MPSDLKSLAVMVAGSIAGIYAVRQMQIMPDVFRDLTYKDAIIKVPELGLGNGKDNLHNTLYMIPAAVAVGAYFLM